MTEDEMIRAALAAPCDMRQQDPYDFAWCETHDETFPLGAICSRYRATLERRAITVRANGNALAERDILDGLALDERARQPRPEE